MHLPRAWKTDSPGGTVLWCQCCLQCRDSIRTPALKQPLPLCTTSVLMYRRNPESLACLAGLNCHWYYKKAKSSDWRKKKKEKKKNCQQSFPAFDTGEYLGGLCGISWWSSCNSLWVHQKQTKNPFVINNTLADTFRVEENQAVEEESARPLNLSSPVMLSILLEKAA